MIEAHLNLRLSDLPESELTDAMRYAVTGGGKRLRGFLVLEGAALHNVPQTDAIGAASAIECIHAFSLVHDDMPCMDDDDLRRGKPTVHKKWDEAMAVLAGDGLQSFAFELVADGALQADRKLALSQTLAQAAGATGMAYGQALDIAAETSGAPLSLNDITIMQSGKTGALIEWSAAAGPRMVGADPAPLLAYAKALGLAFQIADDILDVEGDEAKTGKRLKKDADAGKATFVSHLGLDGAKKRARELVAEAIDALSLYSAQADYLRDAARFVISRDS
ncbi:MAG: polyprenyl synthetase family protein [Paracoccaceae bacterium]|nr:polyprenyl synthetase family protein [Paracoccaceae bacterium]